MKKGQINQIFIYIMAVIIFAAIMLYGYKAIHNIIVKGDYVEYNNFKKNFENTIENSKSYGEINVKSFLLPPGTSQICIVDLSETDTGRINSSYTSAIVKDAWEVRAYNVFLLPAKYDNLLVEGLQVSDAGNKFLCEETSPAKSKITLRFEGLGNAVRISKG